MKCNSLTQKSQNPISDHIHHSAFMKRKAAASCTPAAVDEIEKGDTLIDTESCGNVELNNPGCGEIPSWLQVSELYQTTISL